MRHSLASPGSLACRLAAALGLAILAVPLAAKAQDVGDPVNGRKLAQAWCANCHAFPGSTQATVTGAPSFTAIAANKAMTPLALRAFLQTSHDRMPDLHLSNDEMDDLVAFVLSSGHR
jgi:mono/diheme cytochrome c family protein